MARKSFSVRIFLQDGHAEGVKIVAKSKWSGRALVIPRGFLESEINRVELNAPGLYLLIGPSTENTLPTIYVGSSDPVCVDLHRHHRQETFWDTAIVFAAKDNSLGLNQFEYFASRLLLLVNEVKRARLVNLSFPDLPEIPPEDLTATDEFFEHILNLCPVLGLSFFEKSETDKPTVNI